MLLLLPFSHQRNDVHSRLLSNLPLLLHVILGYGKSEISLPRGGFGIRAVFSLALSLMPQIFSLFFPMYALLVGVKLKDCRPCFLACPVS